MRPVEPVIAPRSRFQTAPPRVNFVEVHTSAQVCDENTLLAMKIAGATLCGVRWCHPAWKNDIVPSRVKCTHTLTVRKPQMGLKWLSNGCLARRAQRQRHKCILPTSM